MKEWKLQVLTYTTHSPDKRVWGDWRDRYEKVLPPMTLEDGTKEMLKIYQYINRALCLRLFNARTGEAIPVEAFE